MNTLKTELTIGLDAPVTLLHISDTHLALADERDCERKRELAERRAPSFRRAEEMLQAASQMQKETGHLIIHTGDLLDFVSEANLDRAKAFVTENDVFFAAGNHEFSQYVGEAFEDADYRNQSLAKVQAAFANDIRFASRIVGGVNLVAIDDGYYLFDGEFLPRLKAEAAKGLPIILLMHNPLFEEKLYDVMMERDRAKVAYLTATPLPLMAHYSEYRLRQQTADEATLAMVDYIKSEPLIQAIIAGHLHFDYEGMVTDTLPQIVTGTTTVREILVK
ncbi:MAG: hypothetical protein E7632_02885 [Ruminococcaceae bacterium]|nr:hypothetical protein [Oscillospiraceae bacterium]